MAFYKINFNSELSKQRMLEIQYLTRHRALSTAEIAREMDLSQPCLWPFLNHMKGQGILEIERQDTSSKNNKLVSFYRYIGPASDVSEVELTRRAKPKPAQRDQLVAALFGAA